MACWAWFLKDLLPPQGPMPLKPGPVSGKTAFFRSLCPGTTERYPGPSCGL